MPSPLHDLIVSRIREKGPLTAAGFIDLALYHPEYGYYSTTARRSGRHGDFVTSVDTGPLFGEMLAVQLGEMWRELGRPAKFDLVEAGAGNGLLMRDLLDAARASDMNFYGALRVTLVDRSPAARAAHGAMLGPHPDRFVRSEPDLPSHIEGVILANELLDAMPVHLAVTSGGRLQEIYITVDGDRLREIVGELSTPRIADFVDRAGMAPAEGVRIEAGLAAVDWLRGAARSLRRGFLVLFDYGYDARQLAESGGTLGSYRRHTHATDDWLRDPGERDLTAHVNLTAVRNEAKAAGLDLLGATNQTHFLLSLGIVQRLSASDDAQAVARRRAATSLVLPEGLGGTQQVVVFGKNAGRPALRGLSQTGLL